MYITDIIYCLRLNRVKVFTIGKRKKYYQLNDNSFNVYPVINIDLYHAYIEMKILPSCGAFTMDNIFNQGVYVSYSNHDNCMETNRFFLLKY